MAARPEFRFCLKAALLAAAGAVASAAMAEPRTRTAWRFEPTPDACRPEAVFDWRSLNEPVAGQSGFVRAGSDGDLLLGDGRPARFWAVTTYVGRELDSPAGTIGDRAVADLAAHARFLAKRGVNLVKVLAAIHPHRPAQPDAPIEGIHPTERDWIWRTVAAMRAEGIYTTITFYWPLVVPVNPGWGLGTEDMHGLVFFEPRVQAAYRAWLRDLFVPKNPYTGVALAGDPAVAFVTLVHEDSLLFWTRDRLAPPHRRLLEERFASWAAARHGSVAGAQQAWGGEPLPEDGPDRLELLPTAQFTGPAGQGRGGRHAAQVEFLADTMRRFYADTVSFLRETAGARWLVNTGNWRPADPARLIDAERMAGAPGDIDAANRYFGGTHQGPNAGWIVQNGDLIAGRSVLREPARFPLALRQRIGRPFVMTESSWTAPNACVAEGPLLVSAYSALTGFDCFIWFRTPDVAWNTPRSPNGVHPGIQKWDIDTPCVLGQFPAASLIFRRGDVRRAEPVSVERRRAQDVWAGAGVAVPEDHSNDPNPSAGPAASGAEAASLRFLRGPVVWDASEEGEAAPAAASASCEGAANGVVASATGELAWDARRGVFTMDAPRAQAVAGFLGEAGVLRTSAIEWSCGNRYAVLVAVSLDGLPLAESARILVQMGTEERPDGWRTEPATVPIEGGGSVAGERIVATGGEAWMIDELEARIVLANPAIRHAWALDENGMRSTRLEVGSGDGRATVTLPSRALYVLLER